MTLQSHGKQQRSEASSDSASPAVTQACRQAAAAAAWWKESWLAFPSVSEDSEGRFSYWDVPEDSGVFAEDWRIGEDVARETLAHLGRFPEGSSVLRRALKQMDFESNVAQGFLNHLEERLSGLDAKI